MEFIMKLMIKTLLLSCLALANAVSFCGGDTGFHNHVPSLLYSATQKLSQKQMADNKINPVIRYVDEINSPRADLSVDEVLSAINHEWIDTDAALTIALDKKRLDIAESIIERMPTQTQEQKDNRINAIKATQIVFSNINTASDIRIMLAELPYVEFPSNDLKAPSGLSRHLVEEIQRIPLSAADRDTAEVFVNSLAHNNFPDLRNRLFVALQHHSTIAKLPVGYDLCRALTDISLEQNNSINQEIIELIKEVLIEIRNARYLEPKLRDILRQEETPSTIKQVRFLLKALPKNYPLEKWILGNAALQNKKAFLALLLEYDNGKIGLFDRCIMRARASIPTKYDNLMLRTVQCAALGFMAYKSFRYFQFLKATYQHVKVNPQYFKVTPQANSIYWKNYLKWAGNLFLGRIIVGLSEEMIR
jgi:hypothetical protein